MIVTGIYFQATHDEKCSLDGEFWNAKTVSEENPAANSITLKRLDWQRVNGYALQVGPIWLGKGRKGFWTLPKIITNQQGTNIAVG